MKGRSTWVITTMVPKALSISCGRALLATRPDATSIELITPCDCSSTIQAVMRTSSDVQNGNSTAIITTLARRAGMRDIQ